MANRRVYQGEKRSLKRLIIRLTLLLAAIVVIKFSSTWRPSFLFPKWKSYAVHGIDVSRYQGRIDWYQLKEHEVEFAFIKASEGKNLEDKKFQYNWEMAREVGIARGAYHFYNPHINWKVQARNFIKKIDLKTGDLPPVLDIEQVHKKNQLHLLKGIRQWLETVEHHYGVRPIVYTYESYYNRFLLNEFRHYNLWIAKYSHRAPKLKDGARWEFWQYSEKGELHGITGKVDMNCFFGSKYQFKKILMK